MSTWGYLQKWVTPHRLHGTVAHLVEQTLTTSCVLHPSVPARRICFGLYKYLTLLDLTHLFKL